MLQDQEHLLKDTLMCVSGTYKSCSGGWSKSYNVITLNVRPNEKIRVGVHLKDYDSGSPDDDICKAEKYIQVVVPDPGVSHSMSQALNGDGGCFVRFTITAR